MKKCKHCGNEMEEDRIFCDNCNWGTPTKKTKQKYYSNDNNDYNPNYEPLNISASFKKCKYCRSVIDKKAKVCPVCKRTISFSIVRVLLAVLIIIGILILLSQCSIRVVPIY